jgi:hypothetical protein
MFFFQLDAGQITVLPKDTVPNRSREHCMFGMDSESGSHVERNARKQIRASRRQVFEYGDFATLFATAPNPLDLDQF